MLPYYDLFPDCEVTPVTDAGVIADDERRLLGEASRERKRTLSVDSNIVSNDQLASSQHPMKVRASTNAPSALGAVRFEERLANEDADKKFVNRANGQKNSEQWNCEEPRDRRQSEIKRR